MAPKNTISQLDLVLLGRRGITARLGNVEGQVKRLVTGTGAEGDVAAAQDLRPNLLTNSSFEYYDRGSTKPQDWAITGSAAVSVGSAGVDGTNSLLLPGGASVTQAAAAGVTVPHASVVISVAAKTAYAGQKIAINMIHAPGVSGGPMMRLDLTGGLIQTDDVPADGNWYRFYRQFILTGGNTASAIFAQAGSGTLEIDAVKFEKEDGVAAWLEPTAYVSADWGAATHIRNLAAENIVTGTLVVGGSISTNPRISVKDGTDVEIVTIGAPTGGFYGIEVKGAAGLRVSGSGSIEVLGGGDINVGNTGAVNVTGTGGVNVSGGGSVVVTGTGGISVSGGGNINIGSGGDLIIAAGGNATITGSLSVSGTASIAGTTTIGGTATIGGNLLMGASGLIRVGGATGKRIVWAASGMEAYDASNNRRMFLDVDTATWRFFGANSVVMEGDGSLKAGALAWVDAAGFWATDNVGNAAFGVSGLDTHLWGGKVMDKGDVMLGGNTSYLYWDASTSKVTLTGDFSAAGGKVVANDIGITIEQGTGNTSQLKWMRPGATLPNSYISANWNGSAGGQSQLVLLSQNPLNGSSLTTQHWVLQTGSSWLTWVSDDFGGVNHTTVLEVYSKGNGVNNGMVFTDGALKVGGTVGAFPTAGSITASSNILSGGNFYPGGATDTYFGRSSSGTAIVGGNLIVSGGLFPSNQTTYNLTKDGAANGLVTNGTFRASTNLYVGAQVARYFHDDGTYTRYQGDFVVDGDLYIGGTTGIGWLSGRINQSLLTTSNPTFNIITNGHYMTVGSTGIQYLPTSTNWSTGGTTMVLQGADFSSIAFHDAGSRVDFIVGGSGILRLGYDGGWGAALCTIPGGARVGATGVYIGNTTTAASFLIHLASDSAGKPNGGSWTNSSDRRLKTFEGDYTRGLDDLRQLNPILYRWNGKLHADDGVHAGFFAQEVQEIVPEMVSTIKGDLDGQETDILQLNLSDLPLMLRNAVVQLADEVAALRAEITALKGSR